MFTELCHAATKIQASFRGHMTRKQQAGGKDEPGGNTASGISVKTENIESQLKNVDINKVRSKYIILLRGDSVDSEFHAGEFAYAGLVLTRYLRGGRS